MACRMHNGITQHLQTWMIINQGIIDLLRKGERSYIHMYYINELLWRLEGFTHLWVLMVLNRTDREFSDYKKMEIHLNQFMGSSSSIGARRIRNVCVAFRAASEQNNLSG